MRSALSILTGNGFFTIFKHGAVTVAADASGLLRVWVLPLVLLLAVALISPPGIQAYSNKTAGQPKQTDRLVNGPHGMINRCALSFYQAWLNAVKQKKETPYNPVFDYQLFSRKTGITLRKIEGESVLRDGWFYPWDQFTDSRTAGASKFCVMGSKKLTFADWVVEGGFSADEPEIWMGLRHFFDPLTGLHLTDFSHDWRTWLGNQAVKTVLEIPNATAAAPASPDAAAGMPDMDARTWALTGPARKGFKANPWSWEKGIGYMRKALECSKSPAQKDALFAASWRALGETMHLMADMTVPAHVRNDSHPGVGDSRDGLAPDPYETYVTEALIKSVWKAATRPGRVYSDLRDAVPLQLRKSVARLDRLSDFKSRAPSDLFLILATHTNQNFFSMDTVSGSVTYEGQTIQITSANGQAPYDQPRLTLCKPVRDKDRLMFPDTIYYHNIPMGDQYQTGKMKKIPIAQLSFAAASGWVDYFKGLARYRGFNATYHVNRAMAEHLLPIAVYANARLIDWYMPRLAVRLTSLDPEKAEVRGAVRHHPYGVHPGKTLIYNLPGGPEWHRFHDLYLDGKKLFKDQYRLKVQNNVLTADLSPVKSMLSSTSRVSVALDLGGIRVRSGRIAAAPDCGYWVLEDVTKQDEVYEWKGEGVRSEHKPGHDQIEGDVSIRVPGVLSYSAKARLSWGGMPEVIPSGGRWMVAYKGVSDKKGRPHTSTHHANHYRSSAGMVRAIPGPTRGVFHIDYSHSRSVSAGPDTRMGGVWVNRELKTAGARRIDPGKPADKKAMIQFFQASPTWRDPSDGSHFPVTEWFAVTAETPAGKLEKRYGYRFVKKLNPDQQARLEQTLSNPLYRGQAARPGKDFSAGSTARAAASGSTGSVPGGPELTGLHFLPKVIKKYEPVTFKVDVVNPPEKASYTWWLYKKVSKTDKKRPQPLAWTKVPELSFTYGRSGTFYVTVWLTDKNKKHYVARQSWQVTVTD